MLQKIKSNFIFASHSNVALSLHGRRYKLKPQTVLIIVFDGTKMSFTYCLPDTSMNRSNRLVILTTNNFESNKKRSIIYDNIKR